MPWYVYRGRSYYSRFERRGGVVRRVHIGSGPVAQLAAALDARRRAERLERDQAWRTEEARHAAADGALGSFTGRVDEMVRGTLESAGYYRHDRGEWRRRRM